MGEKRKELDRKGDSQESTGQGRRSTQLEE